MKRNIFAGIAGIIFMIPGYAGAQTIAPVTASQIMQSPPAVQVPMRKKRSVPPKPTRVTVAAEITQYFNTNLLVSLRSADAAKALEKFIYALEDKIVTEAAKIGLNVELYGDDEAAADVSAPVTPIIMPVYPTPTPVTPLPMPTQPVPTNPGIGVTPPSYPSQPPAGQRQ